VGRRTGQGRKISKRRDEGRDREYSEKHNDSVRWQVGQETLKNKRKEAWIVAASRDEQSAATG
jgi:hypothetical protein